MNPYELDTMVFALDNSGFRYYNITVHDLSWWLSEMFEGPPHVDQWIAVPDDLLLPGMQAAYFNAHEFLEDHAVELQGEPANPVTPTNPLTVIRDGTEVYRGADPAEMDAILRPGDRLVRDGQSVTFLGRSAEEAGAFRAEREP